MRTFFTASLVILLLAGTASARENTEAINLLSDLGTPFPAGCLSIELPNTPGSAESLRFNQDITVPSINSDALDADLNVRIWRVACPDDNYSVVIVRLRARDADDSILVPEIYAKTANITEPFSDDERHRARLQTLPTGGEMGAAGTQIPDQGKTWILSVDPYAIDPQDPDNLTDSEIFTPEEYNDQFTIEMTWENYSTADTPSVRIPLDAFNPAVDLPQFDQTLLNGRYSGQWVIDGVERQGLVLQIGEQADTNFVFAIFFTYLDDEPIWLTGNSSPAAMNPGPITIDVVKLEEGVFLTADNQPPASEIITEPAGQISIEAIDCNTLRMNYDFGPINQGNGTLILNRLIRIAGYDCNVWQ